MEKLSGGGGGEEGQSYPGMVRINRTKKRPETQQSSFSLIAYWTFKVSKSEASLASLRHWSV